MNLVCRTSKIREKTRRQAQPGDWGRLSGCFSQIREKTDCRGGKGDLERERGGGGSDSTCIVSLYNRSRSMPPWTALFT